MRTNKSKSNMIKHDFALLINEYQGIHLEIQYS